MTTLRLSSAQRAIVDHNDGALLVVAGPGSGKTRVLTERVRRLLTELPGHFRVLALTFTNKAAAEMQERLKDLGDAKKNAFIGTIHGFCLEMLTDRGKAVGVTGQPQIFEHATDRKQILMEAVAADPILTSALEEAGDPKARGRTLDRWLRRISLVKAHPISQQGADDPLTTRVCEAYDAGLRACGAYDFDDLLLLGYRLLSEQPKVADFYRRLYKYVCIDEAQDLNEAQYSIIRALCGDEYRNVMMVGDPKQSIYGFNTSSPKYMDDFAVDFAAKKMEMTENYRSSQSVVRVARALAPTYLVEAQLPVAGEVKLLVGADENAEAELIADAVETLVLHGHPDVEGDITYSRCAVLGRTRYTLLAVERILKSRNIDFFKRLSSAHENESAATEDFLLGLRVLVNPKDRLHLQAIAKRWNVALPAGTILTNAADVLKLVETLAGTKIDAEKKAVVDALRVIQRQTSRIDLMPAINSLRTAADALDEGVRRSVYEDTEVIGEEWDQYLRNGGSRNIGSFLGSMALGTSRPNKEGVALLTVHSSKGLEFEVVFIVGMADGVFPDYRAQGDRRATDEERRNAFVAVTRSKRLLYLSYPRMRQMPWGDVQVQAPSSYLKLAGLIK